MINVKKVIDNLLEKEESEEISVKCEFKDGFLKCADEAKGLSCGWRKIVSDGYVRRTSFLKYNLILLFLTFFALCFALFCIELFNGELSFGFKFLISFIVCALVVEFLYIVITMIYFILRKRYRKNAVTTFKSEGIVNHLSKDISILYDWANVECVIVGRYSISIFTDSPVYFYFDNKCKAKILEAVNKFKPKLKILYMEGVQSAVQN